MSLKSDATPTMGRSKSSSRKPTARSMARLGARPGPPVVRHYGGRHRQTGPLPVSSVQDSNDSFLERSLTMAATHTHSSDRRTALYLAFELGWIEWKLAFATAPADAPRLRSIGARNT